MSRVMNTLRRAVGMNQKLEADKLDVATYAAQYKHALRGETAKLGPLSSLAKQIQHLHTSVLENMPQRERTLLETSGLSKLDLGSVHNVKRAAGVSESDARSALERFAWAKAALRKAERLQNAGEQPPDSFDELVQCLDEHERPPRAWGGADEPARRVTRNQRCPCGSGKRAKRCCYSHSNSSSNGSAYATYNDSAQERDAAHAHT